MIAELALVLSSGFLGAGHCVGMCGPLVLMVGRSSVSGWDNLKRQIIYSAGRLATYSFLGACAAFGFSWLSLRAGSPRNLIVAGYLFVGIVLIWQALQQFGWRVTFSRTDTSTAASSMSCAGLGILRGYLSEPTHRGRFMAGMANGFLPCGLVYAFLAVAARTAHPLHGALTMLAFGLGTVAPMVLTGMLGTLLPGLYRQWILRLAAVCILCLGGIYFVRGIDLARQSVPGAPGPLECPFCAEESQTS